ncbi:unnamed protein product [Paramecium primaurelia]|uniref:Proteasome alpha-type subunits domain-containing protein n=2 Tax=Paramecium TaxID=5884 RepID=A0A8S1T1Q3_9CILI|nr:unnamed protein product [Paramecium primaurelia]CAD8145387.1 unnamed protein product [Paramecium pentaurelia]CAD8160060.1 unnamed protein product [Paramecium pentaurelia]
MSRGSQGHEFYITLFSPEGRLYQVEYAFKAVKTSGLTSIGVKGTDTVCLITEKRVPDKLIDEKSVTNLYNVSEKIGALTTGIPSDARALVTRMRYEAGEFRLKNGYYCPVDVLSKRMADLAQTNTQYYQMRSYGVETILCQYDDELGPLLYKLDPSGHYSGYKATASGVKEQESINYLEKQIKKKADLNYDETIMLAIQTLQNVISQDFKPTDIEVGIVTKQDKKFHKLTNEQVDHYLNLIANRD